MALKKYNVQYRMEVHSNIIEVEAESEEEAKQICLDMAYSGHGSGLNCDNIVNEEAVIIK